MDGPMAFMRDSRLSSWAPAQPSGGPLRGYEKFVALWNSVTITTPGH